MKSIVVGLLNDKQVLYQVMTQGL